MESNDLTKLIAAILAREAAAKTKSAKRMKAAEESIGGVRIIDETEAKPKKAAGRPKKPVAREASPDPPADIKKPSKALALGPRMNVTPMKHDCNCAFCHLKNA